MFPRLLLATVAFVAAVAHPHGPPPHPPPFPVGSPGCANLVTEYGHFCKSSAATATHTKYLVCSSDGDEKVECPIAAPPYQKVMAVTLDKAHTEDVCQEGESYGWQEQSIWVKGGCTATFVAQLTLDDEHCDATRDEIELQECETALLDLATCHADMETFCSNVCRNGACGQPAGNGRPWQGQRDEEGHGPHGMGGLHHHHHDGGMGSHGHHGMGDKMAMSGHGMHPPHHHHGGNGFMGHWGQPPLSPVAFKLGQCLQEHMPSLSQECRQTALVQTLTAPPPPDFDFGSDFVEVVATATASVFMFVMVISGFAYFFMRRRLLDGRRLAGAEKTGSWSTGLFTCHCKSLLPSCLFPSFQSALNQAEVHDRSSTVADVAMNMATHSLISNTYYTRQAIRAKYDMPEEPMADCLASICCLPCAIAQNTRELEARYSVDNEVPYVEPVMGKVMAAKEASDMMI